LRKERAAIGSNGFSTNADPVLRPSLPYRQTEGLGRALLKLLEANVAVPDFTSLAKRAGKTNVSLSRDKASIDKAGPIAARPGSNRSVTIAAVWPKPPCTG